MNIPSEHDLELLNEGRKEMLSDDPDDIVCTCWKDNYYEKIIELDVECPIHGIDYDERDRQDEINFKRGVGY
jgi:hypothetical protein